MNAEEKNKTPFDHWWAIYPGPRKHDKKGCRTKFDKHPIEVQRIIYQHTLAMRQSEDWTKDGGQFVPMPATYLNQERWESPATPQQQPAAPGPSKPAEDTAQMKLQGLERLAAAAEKAGVDDKIQGQLQELREKMGASDG